MKARNLETLSDDQLMQERAHIDREIKRRIAQSEKHVAKLRHVIEPSGNHAPLRKRHLNITPVHREISQVVQQLRHARERKDPKEAIKKLETRLEGLREELASANRERGSRSNVSRGIRRKLRGLGHQGGVRGPK